MSKLQQFQALAAVTRKITSSRDALAIARLVVAQAASFTGADAVLITGWPNSPARIAAATGRAEAAVGLSFPLDETSAAELQRLLEHKTGDRFICLPLAHGEFRGLLAVHQSRKSRLPRSSEWPEETKTLLAALADQAAIALEQAEWRAQAEEALQAARAPRPAASAAGPGTVGALDETLFRELLEAAPDALIVAGVDQRIRLVNAQAETLFGYAREELVGTPVETLMPERFRERHARHLARYFAKPQARAMGAGLELYARHKEGREILVEVSLSPLETPEGTLVLSAIRDVTRRRRADGQFRSLLEAAPDSIVITDVGGRIVLVNRETERVFGYAREELLNQPVEVLLPERFRRQHVHHRTGYQAAPRTRTMGLGLELAARRKDGSEFPVEISLSPSPAEDGTLIISVIRDVSERKRAEARFRSLLEAAPDAMVISNPDGEILLVNSQAEKLFGGPRETLVGQPVETLIPERLRERHVGHRTVYAAAPTMREMGSGLELFARRADGGEIPVEISLSPLEADEGLLITSSIRDVSERRRAQAELRQQTALLREQARLINLAHDAILVRDLEDRIILWNRGAEETYGFSPAEACGQVIHALLQSRFPASQDEVNTSLLERGWWEGELRHTTRDGDHLMVASRQVLQRDEAGEPRAILEINRDITQQKHAAEERTRLLEIEREKSEQLTLSIREAHHRIKNNLQAITDLLSLELSSTQEPASHQALRESIERIGAIALVHDFLSRDQDFEQVEVHRVVERLVPMVLRGSGLPADAVEAEVATVPLSLPSKQATALALVVNELVSNSVKHAFATRWGGRLKVTMSARDGHGLLTVQDDGPGLKPDFDLDADANVGLQVVMTLVRSNLDGQLLLSGSEGVRAEVMFSLAIEEG